MGLGRQLAMEPPFRLLCQKLLRLFPVSVQTADVWELNERPPYFAGVHAAVRQARSEGVKRITAVELGVAGGKGLLALERCASRVSAATGVAIDVAGFDSGSGLPQLCGDYRDHPDQWKPADYPMDVEGLRARLQPGTKLVLGNVEHTIPEFVAEQHHPLGFVAFDLDLYSSTKSALRLFTLPDRQVLKRTFLYFDDIEYRWNHRFAGELLAIEEFNTESSSIRIDMWRGLNRDRPFPERPWLRKMYIAHDLEAISDTNLERHARVRSKTL
jgi:hypothetical protein